MTFKKIWDFIDNFKSTDELFNQYIDKDPRVDLDNAPEIRKENLDKYFRCFCEKTEGPRILVVGEAAGPWGCRFSGVPFTGEKQLQEHVLPFKGSRSSKEVPLLKIRRISPYTSISAEIFWKVMKPYHPKFIVWDCVPFHPHYSNNILSVRNPKVKEILSCSELLKEIRDIFEPKLTLAVGRKAEFALKKIGVSCDYIRHLSQGGSNEFKSKIERSFKKDC